MTFAAAALSAEPMSFWDRLLVAACQAVITLAFAVVGVNAIADRWRKREWARRTQYVALLLFERAQDELADLAETAWEIVATSLPESRRQNLHPAAPAFRLPVGPIQNQHWIATVDAVSELEEPLREDWTAAHQHLDRLQERKLHVDFDAIYDMLRGLQDQVRRAFGEEPSRRVPKPAGRDRGRRAGSPLAH